MTEIMSKVCKIHFLAQHCIYMLAFPTSWKTMHSQNDAIKKCKRISIDYLLAIATYEVVDISLAMLQYLLGPITSFAIRIKGSDVTTTDYREAWDTWIAQ